MPFGRGWMASSTEAASVEFISGEMEGLEMAEGVEGAGCGP